LGPAVGAAGAIAVVGAAVLLGPELLGQEEPCPGDADAGADGACAEPGGDVTCWTGTRVDHVADCSEPVGVEGLRWAFPSLDRDFASCYRQFDPTDDPETDASLRTWFCPAPGSRTEGIGYTEWVSTEAARSHFEGLFGREAGSFVLGGSVTGHQWVRPEPNSKGFYKQSVLYEQQPFSATVWAETPEGVARVCAALTARSGVTFRAEPVQCEPVP